MSFRRTPTALAVAVIAALAVPAVASAHHLDNNASTATCELVNGQPTLTVNAVFVAFEDSNKPVNYAVEDNTRTIDTGVFTWNGPNYTKTLTYSVAPGLHAVTFKAWWGDHYSGGSGTFNRITYCPVPPPPPEVVAPAPPPLAPTSPVVVPPAPSVPPATATSPTGHRPCVPYPKSRFRLTIRPPMNTIDHGQVTFRVRGPHIKWVRFHVDHRWAVTDRSRPFKTSVWLWRTDVWGPTLWGRHTIRVTVRTKCRRIHLRKTVFNHDPPTR